MIAFDGCKLAQLFARIEGTLLVIPDWRQEKCQVQEKHTFDHLLTDIADLHERDHDQQQPKHQTRKGLAVGQWGGR